VNSPRACTRNSARLAYNCSPSFNWRRHLDDKTILHFQEKLGELGYKFQFVTLAGFHTLNASMFELAKEYVGRHGRHCASNSMNLA
jgi:isocitrate lyase